MMNKRILVVDDDPLFLGSLKRSLREYDLECIDNPFDAIDRLNRSDPYALLISDYKMPGMNGVDFFEKAIEIAPNTLRIMITGFADLQTTMDAVNRAGVFQFLIKPFEINDLKEAIQKGLEEYHRFEQKEVQQKEYLHQAMHDGLTGLPNRTLFLDRLTHALLRSSRFHTLMAVLFIDLDRFKPINDTYGHEAGDKMLKHVARQLTSCLRNMDTVARIGGDEFAVLVQDLHTQDDVRIICKKILEAIVMPIDVADGVECSVDASIGVSLHPGSEPNAAQMLKRADKAMYEAKKVGGTFIIDMVLKN